MIQPSRCVMIADDEPHFQEIFKDLLAQRNYVVISASGKEEAMRKVLDYDVHVLLLDKRFPHDNDGLEVLRRVREVRPETEVIMLTAYPDAESNLEAISQGASAYLLKTGDYDKLLSTISHMLEVIELRKRNQILLSELEDRNANLERIRTTMQRWNENLLTRLESFAEQNNGAPDLPVRAETANAAFFGLSLCHEVKNRLQVMSLSLELAREEPNADLPGLLDLHFSQLNQLAEVVNSYRDLIRCQPGERSEFSSLQAIQLACGLSTLLCLSTRVRLERVLPERLPTIDGYENLMVNALFNLLKNGIEAAREVSPQQDPFVRVRAFAQEGNLIIEVENRSNPLPEEIRENLFAMEFSSKTQGMGIGLKIAKNTFVRHGGTVTFLQPSQDICQFHVVLPTKPLPHGS